MFGDVKHLTICSIPYEEFLKIQEELDDYEDLKELSQAKEAERNAPTVSLEEAKKELGI